MLLVILPSAPGILRHREVVDQLSLMTTKFELAR